MVVPLADNTINFSIEGTGKIVATDNGDPTNFTPFPSHQRKAFNGLALVIVKGLKGEAGEIIVTAKSDGIQPANVRINTTSN